MAGDVSLLRRIVLESADVLPTEVSAYLDWAARDADSRVQSEILQQHETLGDRLTGAYVDFAIRVLVQRVTSRQREMVDLLRSNRSFPLEDSDYFPAAHLRGPFLFLLARHEDEGLRLIHALVNAAVRTWRELRPNEAADGAPLEPLPTVLNLPGGPHKLWGDTAVYQWYRAESLAARGYIPPAVTSALMALEVWLEHEVASGRDPVELFQKVLSESDCVAVSGLCLSTALAHPSKCHRAAYPLVSSPAIWRMDRVRFAHDSTRSNYSNAMGDDDPIYRARKARDELPMRRLNVSSLVPVYLFSQDEELRLDFERMAATFTVGLPFQYESERDNAAIEQALREEMEECRAVADRRNYSLAQHDGSPVIVYVPPDAIEARRVAQVAPVNEYLQWADILGWAVRSIDEGQVAPGREMADVVSVLQQSQQPDDFSQPYLGAAELESWRLPATSAVAAMIATVAFDRAQQDGLLPWVREALLKAAQMPSGDGARNEWVVIDNVDPRVFAARGLGRLLARGAGDSEIRSAILRLIAQPYRRVREAVFTGLWDAWEIDAPLCWTALSFAFALAITPARIARLDDWPKRRKLKINHEHRLLRTHLGRLERNQSPDPPRIATNADDWFNCDEAVPVLSRLPLDKLMAEPSAGARVLGLARDLLAWTIARNTPDSDDPDGRHIRIPYEWNQLCLRRLAWLARLLPLDQARQDILAPVREAWAAAPHLTSDLLEGLLFCQINPMGPLTEEVQATWREVCDWVLGSAEVREAAGARYIPRNLSRAISLVIFVEESVMRGSISAMKAEWPHAELFIDVIDRWVTLLAHHPEAYIDLLTMLEKPGWRLTPQPALTWITSAISASADRRHLLRSHENGARTGNFLARLWFEKGESVRRQSDTLNAFSDLVEILVDAGIQTAGALQVDIDRHRSPSTS